jgi:predicted Rossmann fold nucleotide-binding protein DprA/Smf involved in DNA uptake
VSFAPNQLIKQGAKLATCAEDVIEELPRPSVPPSCRPSSEIYWPPPH